MNERNVEFLICPRKKGNPRMHVDLCSVCRWNLKCPAYGEYRQPLLLMNYRDEGRKRKNRHR